MKKLDLVPLRAAVLCANRELIGVREDAGRCIACGSSAVLLLSRVLGSLGGLLPAAEARNNHARSQPRLISWPGPGSMAALSAQYYSEQRTTPAHSRNADPACA